MSTFVGVCNLNWSAQILTKHVSCDTNGPITSCWSEKMIYQWKAKSDVSVSCGSIAKQSLWPRVKVISPKIINLCQIAFKLGPSPFVSALMLRLYVQERFHHDVRFINTDYRPNAVNIINNYIQNILEKIFLAHLWFCGSIHQPEVLNSLHIINTFMFKYNMWLKKFKTFSILVDLFSKK